MNITAKSALCLVLSALALCASELSAQVAGLSFDVASVKPNNSGDRGSRLGMSPNGRMTATNVSLKQLILNAYNLRDFQLTGGPAWLDVDRFDISATAGHAIQPGAGGAPQELFDMVKNLLADRFKLLAHTETRDAPIYRLVLARPDGKLGPKMRASDVDCAALASRGAMPAPPAPGQMGPCGTRFSDGHLAVRAGTLAQITRTFAGLPGVARIVVDSTGLTGSFDIDLDWAQDPSADAAGPSIFTAVQEQVGLKLESSRGPVDVLVIDHAEPPTPD
jgi:uncharacterized protein (TIGR03435 family)